MTSNEATDRTDGAQDASKKQSLSEVSSDDQKQSMRDRRVEALLHVKKALELAEDLKLVSLNIAVASAQTKSENWDVRKLKAELAELTNQAVKASKETSALIEAISGKDGADDESSASSVVSREATEFRRAIDLRKNLEELLGKCRLAVSALDRIDGGMSE